MGSASAFPIVTHAATKLMSCCDFENSATSDTSQASQCLLVLCGLPGAGKTTAAAQLRTAFTRRTLLSRIDLMTEGAQLLIM